MNEKLEEIMIWVEEKLSTFSELKEFKIGKASDCEDRFETDYQKEGYDNYLELAYGSPKAINDGEKFLIGYFRNHPTWKDKCVNKIDGGGGNRNATRLYLVVKYEMNTIDDLYDGLLQEEWKPIKLD